VEELVAELLKLPPTSLVVVPVTERVDYGWEECDYDYLVPAISPTTINVAPEIGGFCEPRFEEVTVSDRPGTIGAVVIRMADQ
jgi:hypothetical protein